MLRTSLEHDSIRFGRRFAVAFQRTLRVPDDGRQYPLPPGLGRLPVRRVADYAARVPPEWRARGGFFVPLYQSEALWLAFEAAWWKPNAVRVGVGGVDAVSGGAWADKLTDDPQNYLVCPGQLWLDGVNVGGGAVRQFVAAPLGSGLTVEAQLTGQEVSGGIQLRVHEPKPGRFPARAPRREPATHTLDASAPRGPARSAMMGLGAGGRMRQKIYPDPHGLDAWDANNYGEALVHLVNAEQYAALTGEPPPPTPVNARLYTERGLPWFDLYDADRGTVAPGERLANVRSVREVSAARDPQHTPAPDASLDFSTDQVRWIKRKRD